MLNIPLMTNNSRDLNKLLSADKFNLLVDNINNLLNIYFQDSSNDYIELKKTIIKLYNNVRVPYNYYKNNNETIFYLRGYISNLLNLFIYNIDNISDDSIVVLNINDNNHYVKHISDNSYVTFRDIKYKYVNLIKDGDVYKYYGYETNSNGIDSNIEKISRTSKLDNLSNDTLYVLNPSDTNDIYQNEIDDSKWYDSYKFVILCETYGNEDPTQYFTVTDGSLISSNIDNKWILYSNDNITSIKYNVNYYDDNYNHNSVIKKVEFYKASNTLNNMDSLFNEYLGGEPGVIVAKFNYKWDSSNVISMNDFFRYTLSLDIIYGLNRIDLRRVKSLRYFLYSSKVKILDGINNIQIRDVDDMYHFMSYTTEVITKLDFSNYNLNNLKNLSHFMSSRTVRNYENYYGFVKSSVTNISYMFSYTKFMGSDPNCRNWDTSSVTDFSGFMRNTNIKYSVDTQDWGTSNATSFRSFMYNCYEMVTPPDTSNWNTSNVTDFGYFLYGCTLLSTPPDTSNWDISNVTSFKYFLYNCTSLESPPNTSTWNTSNVTNFTYFMSNCTSLNNPPDTSNWDISSTDYLTGFLKNTGITTPPDTGNWNTSNVRSFYYFMSKTNIVDPPNTSNWDTSNVTDFDYFLSDCNNLETAPDVSNWDVSNVYYFSNFLKNTKITELDTCGWTFSSNGYTMYNFLYNCQNLETVTYLDTRNASNKYGMLSNCPNLVHPSSSELNDLKDDDGAVVSYCR